MKVINFSLKDNTCHEEPTQDRIESQERVQQVDQNNQKIWIQNSH